MAQVFRIKHMMSGLFSKGGTHPQFGTKGKLWVSRGALSNHLNLANSNGRTPYKDCELITYELEEVEVDRESMTDAINATKHRREAREQIRLDRRVAFERECKLRQLEQLKKDLGIDK